jgi:hypothetical protein
MKWEDWRWVIYGEVNEKSVLNEYKMFKREKLKPAITEINAKSDLNIELIENKDGGRSVKYLQFIVEEKPVFRVENDAQKEERGEWDKRLEDLGLSLRDRRKILATYTVEQIDAHWRFTMDRVNDKSQAPIKSPGAYLKRALEGNYAGEAAAPTSAPAQAHQVDSLDGIRQSYMQARNAEAEGMFKEMLEPDREALVDEYNGAQQSKASAIPAAPGKRLPRHMIPFYAWLAAKYWGEPTAQELFEFAVKTGAISFNAPQS